MPHQQTFTTSRTSLPSLIALAILLLASTNPAFAQTESIVYSFQSGAFDGAYPSSGLIADAAGNFYGTASAGGTDGTVFQYTTGGAEITLHTFTGPDGNSPQAGLVMDAHGNLYGTTISGGNYDSGVVFELKPISGGGWNFFVLHNFDFDGINNFDGWQPRSALVMDKAGNLYGTTEFGGTGQCFDDQSANAPKGQIPTGCGTVFEVSPHSNGTWSEKILYNFQGGSDGGLPFAGLIFDHKGNLYGTTFEGGTGNSEICGSFYDGGCGVVFSLTRSAGAWTENVLYAFLGQNDGANPTAPVIFDHAGNLYGTTNGGNLSFNSNSTVFELSPSSGGAWTETTILAFNNEGVDTGFAPFAGLIFDSKNNLYGTTYYGSGPSGGAPPKGGGGGGVVFKLTPSDGTWTETVLHSFANTPDGYGPGYGDLLLTKGALYGTTIYGGTGNFGTIFKVVP